MPSLKQLQVKLTASKRLQCQKDEGLDSCFVHSTFIVKPPNKGHFGNNINSSLLSFVERLSSSRRFKMY